MEIQTKGRLGTAPAVARRSATLWEFGFRPFYLLASLFACASLLLWIAQYSGLLPQPYLAGPLWHGHEMLFGFATAVIAGFLLTAVATWTQQPPTRGMLLAGLVLIWLAARVLVLTPWPLAAAAANLLFPLAVAAVIAVPLVRTRNRRNMLFIGLLALLAVLAALLHLAAIGAVALPAAVGLQAGLDVVLLVIVIIAGRVVPMFTNNGVPGAGATRNPMLEWAAPASVIVLLGADLLQVDGLLLAAIAWVGAGVQAARLALWRPWRTWRTPLVWILHAGYAWIALHLALRGIAAIGWLMPSVAVHALTVGAIGGMTIGMMTRTARGPYRPPAQGGGCGDGHVRDGPGSRARPGRWGGFASGSISCWRAAFRLAVECSLRALRADLLAGADPAAHRWAPGIDCDGAGITDDAIAGAASMNKNVLTRYAKRKNGMIHRVQEKGKKCRTR